MYPILTLGDKVSVILAICDIKEENQGVLSLPKWNVRQKSQTPKQDVAQFFLWHTIFLKSCILIFWGYYSHYRKSVLGDRYLDDNQKAWNTLHDK